MSSRTSVETGLSRLSTATLLTLPTEQLEDADKTPMPDENACTDTHAYRSPQREYAETTQVERYTAMMFSDDHLKHIIETPSELLKFTAFLKIRRPECVRVLVYYLDILKASNALAYTNAVLGALNGVSDAAYTSPAPKPILSLNLEERAASAFRHIAEEYLPAYISQAGINHVANGILEQVAASKEPSLHNDRESLAEMFFLTDPTKSGTPIVFASDAFKTLAAYDEANICGQSIRILAGPGTTDSSIQRVEEAYRNGREHCEVMLCYPRNGPMLLGLLMISPLCDSRGKIRYYLGSLSDVSTLAEDSTNLESFQGALQKKQGFLEDEIDELERRDALKDLSEMFNMHELLTIQRWGGRMHGDHQCQRQIGLNESNMRASELVNGDWLHSSHERDELLHTIGPKYTRAPFQHYLLLRPFPSLRVLFASPSLRLPGVLQSPFLSRVGGSRRVREGLTNALAEGRSVTAKIRWTTSPDEGEQTRWVHCTPLRGQNGRVGVWAVLLVEDVRRRERPMSIPLSANGDWNENGVLWRETDDESDADRPRTSHRVSKANSWADRTSFRSFGTDDASSIESGSRYDLSVH